MNTLDTAACPWNVECVYSVVTICKSLRVPFAQDYTTCGLLDHTYFFRVASRGKCIVGSQVTKPPKLPQPP